MARNRAPGPTEAAGVRAAFVSLVFVTLLGCDAPRPDRPARSGGTSAIELVVEPLGGHDAAWPASHFRVRGAAIDPAELLLVHGELSDYYLARIAARDLPKTLLERVVAAGTWTEDAETVLVPAAPLERGESYSLAAPETGLVGQVRVLLDAPPLLERLWPPAGASGGTEHAVYCGIDSLGPYPLITTLEPGHRSARVHPGIDDRGSLETSCVTIEPEVPLGEGEIVVPPILLGLAELDPAPLMAGHPAPPVDRACTSGELRFGPGCAEVFDD